MPLMGTADVWLSLGHNVLDEVMSSNYKASKLSGKGQLNSWASTVGTQALGTKFQVDANTVPSL